jgi:ABC-type multidrug transport system ATPase subunit
MASCTDEKRGSLDGGLHRAGGVDISWHVNYSEPEHSNPKVQTQILSGVSGSVPAGECLAILGPSGAGKTSLLNVLSGKVDKFQGHVSLGGVAIKGKRRQERISFVEQHDFFLGLLTIEEHMDFHARLRLHALPQGKRKEQVTKVLSSLGLADLTGRQIMIISGGEKKRLSIAEELLNDPQVMILDEPTSQLDSHMASNVIDILQNLARQKHKSIVFTIHQPSSALFQSFSRVLFLAKGWIAYDGVPKDLASFLGSVGQPVPTGYSIAEFMLDRISQAEADVLTICDAQAARHATIASKAVNGVNGASHLEDAAEGTNTWMKQWAPWWVEYAAICKRTFIQRKRQRMQTKFNIASSLIISMIAGIIFFGVDDSQASVRNRTGCIFFLFVHPVFSAIFETSMPLVMDAGTLLREYKNKRLYRVSIYYLARTTGELPVQMSFPFIYGTIIYWMVFWREGSGLQYLLVLLTVQLACFTGQSYGYMLSTFSVDFEISMTISIVILVCIFLFSGMMLDITTLPDFVQAISNVSLFKHCFTAGMIAAWKNQDLTCKDNEECLYQDGDAVLRNYKIDDEDMMWALVSLAILSIAARLIGFLRLYSRYVLDDDLRSLCSSRGNASTDPTELDVAPHTGA